jgi:transposase
VLGMIERGGSVVIRMLENVKQKTIGPLIKATITAGTLVNTDEYDIYARLEQWGYRHQSVCHGRGEYARDDDGDGFHEVHVNTMEGFWSLLRSWLRPHRGISQDKLSSSTTSENEERRFCHRSSSCCWSKTLIRIKSQIFFNIEVRCP